MDHCTLWFEGSWAGCCELHDRAYDDPTIDRLTADLDLALCVADAGGWPMAIVMLAGVLASGWVFRWKAQRRRGRD